MLYFRAGGIDIGFGTIRSVFLLDDFVLYKEYIRIVYLILCYSKPLYRQE